MRQVYFITDAPRIAGSEVWLEQTLPRLVGHGLEVALFMPQQPRLQPIVDSLRGHVEVNQYSGLEAITTWNQPDGWIIQAWQPSLYAAVRERTTKPVFSVIHDQIVYHYAYGLKQLYQQIYAQTKVRWFRQLEGCITVSQWGADWLKQRFGLSAISIRNGVNTERFQPQPDRTAIRKALGFERFTVLVPGRFSPEKNQLAALRTARRLPQLDFVFLGDRDSPDGRLIEWLTQIWRLSNVRFWSRRDDMPKVYAAVDVVLQPTLAENQSLVTLEAMSTGVPVVSSNIPAQLELIKHGQTGFAVEAHPNALALVLRDLEGNPALAQQIGQQARAYIEQHHTLEQSAAHMARAILRLK